ncbi:hypothetical protein LZC95_06580 [Pendulispora brunnea]|uniref:Uncharacterized protein n=1 Tax=Pendulispora brunnea TaxID=2905690 RepID=A0ABZ2KHW0_9BACT
MSILTYRALVCGLALAACGGSASKPPAEPVAASRTEVRNGSQGSPETKADAKPLDTAPESETPASPPQPPKVRLLSPGAAPRQALRYRFSVGPSQWSQMDMKMAIGVALGNDVPKAAPLPTMRVSMRIDPKSVSPDGDLRYEFEMVKLTVLRDVVVAPAIREKLEQELGKLTGLKGYAVVTSRGITKEADFVVPPDTSDAMQETLENMRSSLRQMSSPLPEEQAGKGAVWEVETQLVTPAFRMTQTATHTLQNLRPNGMSTRVSFVQNAPRQPMKLKKLPSAKVHLESMLSTGDGKTDVVFDKLVPNSVVSLSTNLQMSVAASDGSTGNMAMSMGVQTNFQPSKPPH